MAHFNDILEISDGENEIIPELITVLASMKHDEQERILKVVKALI